jgi:hypothetical protein
VVQTLPIFRKEEEEEVIFLYRKRDRNLHLHHTDTKKSEEDTICRCFHHA